MPDLKSIHTYIESGKEEEGESESACSKERNNDKMVKKNVESHT